MSPALTPLPHTPTVKCTWWTIVNSHIRVFAQCSVCCYCAVNSPSHHPSPHCQQLPVLAKNCEFTYPGLWSMCRAVNLQPACENRNWIHISGYFYPFAICNFAPCCELRLCEFTYPGIYFASMWKLESSLNSHIPVFYRISAFLQFCTVLWAVSCDCVNSHIRVFIRKVSRICTSVNLQFAKLLWIHNSYTAYVYPNSQLAANVKNLQLPIHISGSCAHFCTITSTYEHGT